MSEIQANAAAKRPLGEPASLATNRRWPRFGRWTWLAVLVVCAAPVIASYLSYYVWRPHKLRHVGELIEPQKPLPAVTAHDLQGHSLDLRSLRGQWLLISVASGACDRACERHLYLQRQLRESLGKDKARLDWVWLINDTQSPSAALRPGLEQALVLRVDAAALNDWLAPQAAHSLADHLYLVDPQGHWMMRFAAPAEASAIKKDLDRLMKASAGWDRPGRVGNAVGSKGQ